LFCFVKLGGNEVLVRRIRNKDAKFWKNEKPFASPSLGGGRGRCCWGNKVELTEKTFGKNQNILIFSESFVFLQKKIMQ